MANTIELQPAASIVVSLVMAIGSLSFLQASGLVVGIICTVAVAISTVKTNKAKRIYFEKQNAIITEADSVD